MTAETSVWVKHPGLYEQVLDLYNTGLSARAVAKKLGLTRNVVCGKLHRMGVIRPAPPPVEKSQKASGSMVRSDWTDRPLPGSTPKAFLDRAHGECAWVLQTAGPDCTVCAQPTHKASSYCRAHDNIAHGRVINA